jgi:hypothetical protein
LGVFRGLDDFEIVLDHHHGVALRRQLAQHFQQLLYVVECSPVVGWSRMYSAADAISRSYAVQGFRS